MRSRFDYDAAVPLKGGKSRCDPSFVRFTDMNGIVERYRLTGVLGDPLMAPKREPKYVDASLAPRDFMEAQARVDGARAAFAALPAAVRRRFDESPASMLAFIQDPANADEAVKLGLFARPEPVIPAPADDGVSATQ